MSMSNDDRYIAEMFDDHTGVLARIIPGYAARTGQTQLAHAIHQTIVGNSVLLGEAPTGTGKTMAYLVPAIMNAMRTQRSVLVVTANKALQEQLIEKDLPLLVKAFHEYDDMLTFNYQLVKGRANYLCQRELMMFDSGAPLAGLDFEEQTEAQALSAWGMTTLTGDQSDAPFGVSQKTWNAFSVSGDRCARRACAFQETCFANRVLDKAEVANVVVANYDLFFSKLKASSEPTWSRFNTVIFDEAHEAANIARRCFGREVGLSHINQLASDVSQYLGDRGLAKLLRETAGPFFEDVARYALRTDAPRVHETNFVNSLDIIDALDDAMRAAKGKCGRCGDAPMCGTCAYRQLIHDRAKLIMEQIQEFTGQTNETTAYWIDKPFDANRVAAASVRLRAVPYRVGDLLSEMVFSKYPAVIATSATLTSGGTFDFIRDELGLVTSTPTTSAPDGEDLGAWAFAPYGAANAADANVHGLRVPSPFNFAKQAKFVVPLGIPWPSHSNDHDFNQHAADAIKTLIHDCKGRLLALFTSWRRLKFVAEQLAGNIDYPLLVQGDAPNKTLTQMFRDQTDSVLLATKSFWMGLDVQGESLSCLVIDKLPLESLSDPLIDMMKQRHPDTFWDDFYFPRAAIELAQGAGRLIRSTTDRGVFVLLDSRIIGKGYGGMMQRSLPFDGFSKSLADAGKFLAAPRTP
jgi:ATP-dependent DNA helicase DinG